MSLYSAAVESWRGFFFLNGRRRVMIMSSQDSCFFLDYSPFSFSVLSVD